MSRLRNTEILDWVEANDYQPDISGYPPVIGRAVAEVDVKNKRADRIFLIDTAIGVALLEHVDQLSAEIDTLIEERREVNVLLGLEMPSQERPPHITPLNLPTMGAGYFPYGLRDRSDPKQCAKWQGSKRLEKILMELGGATATGSTVSKLIKLMVQAAIPPHVTCVERVDGEFRFVGINPEDYGQLVDVPGLGPKAVEGIIDFLSYVTLHLSVEEIS